MYNCVLLVCIIVFSLCTGNNLQPSSETPSNYPPANPSYSTHYPPQSSNYPPPTAYHPTGMQPPPPPQSSTSTPYPPAPSMGYYSNPTAPPPPSGGPSQALGFGGLMSGSRPPSGYPPYQPPAGYSPAPPTLTDYYSAVAGPSFSGAPVHVSQVQPSYTLLNYLHMCCCWCIVLFLVPVSSTWYLRPCSL